MKSHIGLLLESEENVYIAIFLSYPTDFYISLYEGHTIGGHLYTVSLDLISYSLYQKHDIRVNVNIYIYE